MRLQITITELDQARWDLLHEVTLAEYDIPENASRACLTAERDGEERHVEMPLGTLIGLLLGLSMVGVTQGLKEASEAISRKLATRNTATAALRPDELPDRLEDIRNAADPQRAAERAAPVLSDDEAELLDEVPESRSREGFE